MNEEDLKILIFRAEKAAFVLGKVSVAVYELSIRFNDGPLKEDLTRLAEGLAKDCGELYYPVEYFIAKEVSNEETTI